MSIIHRKNSYTGQCEEITTIQPIMPIGPYAGSRTVDYTFPSSLGQFLDQLPADVEQLLSKAALDEFNPDFYDAHIASAVRFARNDLARQRNNHMSAAFCISCKNNCVLDIYRRLIDRYDRLIEENNRFIEEGEML